MNHFTESLGLSRYTLYIKDYGGPVGFRMPLAHPERVEALIVQDAVAHDEGLGANWKTRRAFWADRSGNESAFRVNLLAMATTLARHVGDEPNVERHDPDLWTDEFYFLNQPGQADIQSDLFYDYRTNVESYPKWQAWMREKQPRLLVVLPAGAFGGAYARGSTFVTNAGELISKLTEAERQLLLAYLQNKVPSLQASEDLRAKHPLTLDR
jgi:pimeloyl-ACP methyl ester carboxylesterase